MARGNMARGNMARGNMTPFKKVQYKPSTYILPALHYYRKLRNGQLKRDRIAMACMKKVKEGKSSSPTRLGIGRVMLHRQGVQSEFLP
jgi:hypothetical protein